MQLLSILMERHRKTRFHDFNASQQSGCLKSRFIVFCHIYQNSFFLAFFCQMMQRPVFPALLAD